VIRLLADQNFNGRILNGLARRQPAIDALHIRDIGLSAAADSVILERTASEGRILLTHDRQTVPGFAYARVSAGEPMPGVFLVSKALPIGQAIDEILLAVHCLSPDACRDIVKYFPM
jgi:predicted nuclease of predicted toxin-antitoxin system